MIGEPRWMPWLTYGVLILGVVIIGFPVWVAIAAATQSIEQVRDVPMSMGIGAEFFNNLHTVLDSGAGNSAAPVGRMVFNTFVVALVIAVGKIVISLLSAYAFVFFRFPGRTLAFWLIFITLMLPVEVRIMPTYEVMASLNLINTYTGLTLPLIASATATFLFRQFFMTIPPSSLMRRGSMVHRRCAFSLMFYFLCHAPISQHYLLSPSLMGGISICGPC